MRFAERKPGIFWNIISYNVESAFRAEIAVYAGRFRWMCTCAQKRGTSFVLRPAGEGGAMDREYGGLKRAYGEMSFCWQETAAEEWHKRRLQHEEREKSSVLMIEN